MEALARYGADAIRWYFIVNSAPWLPSRFYGITIVLTKFFKHEKVFSKFAVIGDIVALYS